LVKRDILYPSGAFLYFTFAARNASSWLALSLLGFLSPGNGGTEGGVKTIEGWERLPLSFSEAPLRAGQPTTLRFEE